MEKKYIPRLKKLYKEEIRKAVSKKNIMAAPRLKAIHINLGIGEAKNDIKLLDEASGILTVITGQKPAVRRAKKSISNFKVRAGVPIGVTVTLRKERMYEFLDKLISLALPRTRDFRGLSDRSFDGHGNYTIGIKDQLIFPEVDYNKVTRSMGMNITILTTAGSDDLAKDLLTRFGMPFRR